MRVEGSKKQPIDTRRFHFEHIVLDSRIQYDALLRLIFLFIFIFLSGSESTKITFPYFSAVDNILAFGHAGYNPENRSFIINAGARTLPTGTCGELLYGKNVCIQDIATGRVASFSTSFSFIFTLHQLLWFGITLVVTRIEVDSPLHFSRAFLLPQCKI